MENYQATDKYQFIDTHCHFDFPPLVENPQESLRLAAAAGVEQIIVPAVSADRFALISDLCQRYQPLYGALGLHPLYIDQHDELSLEKLSVALNLPSAKIVALGEVGLDNYFYNNRFHNNKFHNNNFASNSFYDDNNCSYDDEQREDPQLDKQQWLLLAQFKLAKHHDFPLILHSRRTHDLLAKMLKQANLPRTGVIHGFSGSLQQAQAFVRLGYFIGVGGVITYQRAQKTRRTIAELPLTSLLLETDAPDMPPVGFQGQPNRPERLQQIFAALCEIRTEPAELIAQQIYHNSQRLFALGQ